MSTDLKQQIQDDLIEARGELDHAGVEALVTRAIKQRRDASEQMRAGGRPELADKEDAEAEILQAYLPPPMTEAEVRTIVQSAIAGGADQLGALMGQVMPQIRGRFDGKEANRIVREELR